jgi:hypothetical protein
MEALNGVFSEPPGAVAVDSWPAAADPAVAYGFRPAMVEPAELSTFCAPVPAAPTTFCAPVPAAPTTFCAPVPAAPTTPVPAVAAAFVTPVPAVAASLVISGSWVLAAPVTVCPAVLYAPASVLAALWAALEPCIPEMMLVISDDLSLPPAKLVRTVVRLLPKSVFSFATQHSTIN